MESLSPVSTETRIIKTLASNLMACKRSQESKRNRK
jgi:hypothetical protein